MNDREKTVYVINRKYGRHFVKRDSSVMEKYFVKIAILTVFVLALCAGLFLAGIYVTAEDIRSDAAKASRLLTEEGAASARDVDLANALRTSTVNRVINDKQIPAYTTAQVMAMDVSKP